jgi:hypothetical protein
MRAKRRPPKLKKFCSRCLRTTSSSAGDEFAAVRHTGECDQIIAAAARVRDAGLAWARYVEAAAKAPEKSIPGRIDAIFAQLHERGLIVDTGERRWSPKKKRHDVVWVIAPGLPKDYDAGSDDVNAVLQFIREHS